MKTKLYKLPLILLVFLFLSPYTCLADGALDLLMPSLLLMLVGLILLVAGLVIPVINIFSKNAGIGRLNLIISTVILVFAIIFITWGADGFFFDAFLYVSLIGFIIYLNKGSNYTPIRSGILLGLYLLLIRLIFIELGILRSFYLSLFITVLITGLFIFLHFKNQLKPDSILNNGFSHNDGLKISLVSAAFLFVTYFYYSAAERNLNNWFSFRNDNPVGLLETSGLLEFKGLLFFFCGTFITVLVTGIIASWGTKKLYLTKAKAH